jgi:hypothetical protein
MFTFATKDMAGDSGGSHDAQDVQKCECTVSVTLLLRNDPRGDTHFGSSSEDRRY